VNNLYFVCWLSISELNDVAEFFFQIGPVQFVSLRTWL